MPGLRQANEEERQDEGRLPAMEMHGMLSGDHRAKA